MLQQLRARHHLVSVLTGLTLLVLAVAHLGGRARVEAAPSLVVALPAPPDPSRAWRAELDWSRVRADGDGYVQVLRSGGRVELTLDPRLQRLADEALAD